MPCLRVARLPLQSRRKRDKQRPTARHDRRKGMQLSLLARPSSKCLAPFSANRPCERSRARSLLVVTVLTRRQWAREFGPRSASSNIWTGFRGGARLIHCRLGVCAEGGGLETPSALDASPRRALLKSVPLLMYSTTRPQPVANPMLMILAGAEESRFWEYVSFPMVRLESSIS
jgi:hypothetical protein